MNKNVLEKFEKLISVKSIVTIILTIIFSILALFGKVDVEKIYMIIIAFYFGTIHERGKSND